MKPFLLIRLLSYKLEYFIAVVKLIFRGHPGALRVLYAILTVSPYVIDQYSSSSHDVTLPYFFFIALDDLFSIRQSDLGLRRIPRRYPLCLTRLVTLQRMYAPLRAHWPPNTYARCSLSETHDCIPLGPLCERVSPLDGGRAVSTMIHLIASPCERQSVNA